MTAESDAFIIEVRDLVVKYGDRVVLKGINFKVRRGETFVILGGSGCGKSTLLRNLVGLMRPHSGQILINGQDFTGMSDDERVAMRKRMGMCFQGSALLNSISVADNVALPLREHTKLEESTIEIMTKIKLELVGLGGFGDFLPSALSGGMKKRAGLARAMAMDPEIIFYDEPSAGRRD
jgi:phospholipid/cholesterol/gamma-HCH transport system ATP-binding protein